MHVGEKESQSCSGCSACERVCPVHAIKMQPDELGFYYPSVDESVCVDCSICINQCPFHQIEYVLSDVQSPTIYGCRLCDDNELLKSQSGGISHAIVTSLINQGYVVYGAAFESPYHVKHVRVTDMELAKALRGSKYVQSDLNGVFDSVISDLKKGYKVLFIGTSCQVAGIKSVVPEAFSGQLAVVDLICHGAPSPKVWNDHILYQERKLKKKVVVANFRDKRFGWHSRKEILRFNDNKILSVRTFNIITDLAVRRSCANCPFTNYKRVGDITLGDFWGWEKYYKQWHDNKGVSLVMINTVKGKMIFNQLKGVEYMMSSKDKCFQPQLDHPLRLNDNYDGFQADYIKHGYVYAMRKYSDLSIKYRLKQKCYKVKAFLLKLKG